MVVNSMSVPKQGGFILAAVLWTLAIMFIAVGFFHVFVERKLAVGIQAKAHIQQSLDEISTQETLLYLLSTSRMTLAGLTFTERPSADTNGFEAVTAVGDELYFDGTVYKGINGTRFSFQDEAGLISINSEDQEPLTEYLTRIGVDANTRQRLLDSLKDYIDANDLVSLSGAESFDYAQTKMPPLTNDLLRTPLELKNVMVWRDWLREHPEVDLVNEFTVSRVSLINLNNMPEHLLVKSLGVSPALAAQIIQDRKTNPFDAVEAFRFVAKRSEPMNEDKYRFFPSNKVRLRIWNSGGGQARLISLQLTPNGLLGPWLVDYEYSVQSVENNNKALAIRQSTLFDHALDDDIRGH